MKPWKQLVAIVDMAAGTDIGRIFENIVFIQLRRRGHVICYGRQKQEIDFVLQESKSPAHHSIHLDTRSPHLYYSWKTLNWSLHL